MTEDATATLHRLRAVSLRNPVQAAAHLTRLTATDAAADDDPHFRVDLRVLLAEAWQRCGEQAAAIQAGDQAEQAVAALLPLDWDRLIVVAAVSADIAVWTAAPGAATACDNYREAASHADTVDPNRLTLATALRAVTAFHQVDCRDGLRMMAEQHQAQPDGLIGTMLHTAHDAMRDSCARRPRSKPAGHLPPIPGAILQPNPHEPAKDYLVSRIRAHRGMHRCTVGP